MVVQMSDTIVFFHSLFQEFRNYIAIMENIVLFNERPTFSYLRWIGKSNTLAAIMGGSGV